MTIRRAGPADEAAVLALMRRQLAEHAAAPEEARLRDAVAGILGGNGWGFFLLGEEGDTPVGAAYVSFQWSLEHGGRAAWLEELYVVPEARGAGRGAALLEAALADARAAGCAAVDLEVDGAHRRAENLYRRAGFRPHDRSRWVRPLAPASPEIQ